MSFLVGDQVGSMLPLKGLKVRQWWQNTAAAQDDGPFQPEPPEFTVVAAARRLSTEVSCVTDVALIVGTLTGFLILRWLSPH